MYKGISYNSNEDCFIETLLSYYTKGIFSTRYINTNIFSYVHTKLNFKLKEFYFASKLPHTHTASLSVYKHKQTHYLYVFNCL